MIGDRFIGTITKGENVAFITKRHPIGLIPIYLFVVAGSIICLVGMLMLTDSEEILGLDIPDGLWISVFIAIIVFVLFSGFIARGIYWDNELVVTDEDLLQVLRPSFFHRHVARLSLGKVQDVSVVQKGFFQLTFHYGTLIIETSGEVASYRFSYAPHPNEIATKIMQAHDTDIETHGGAPEPSGV